MISYVLCGRNDNYAGYFDERLFLTVKYNFKKFKEHGIPHELIFVEWNPDPTKELFSKKLVNTIPNTRCYVVGKEVHNAIAQEYTWMTFMEFFAKNVAIRRAEGDYILCTNADCFYSDSIFEEIAKGMDENIVYRAERHDIDLDRVLELNEDGFKDQITRSHPIGSIAPYTDAAGDFALMSKKLFDRCTGYDEGQRFVKIHKDSRILFSIYKWKDPTISFKPIGELYHIEHGTSVPTTGLGANYRKANGPYNWKYFAGLPYENQDNWGLIENVEEHKIQDNIYEIKIEKGKKLVYPSDEHFMGAFGDGGKLKTIRPNLEHARILAEREAKSK